MADLDPASFTPPTAWERDVTMVGPVGPVVAHVAWDRAGHRVVLDGPTGRLEATGRDFFDALAEIRRALEPAGWAIAVQGARRDTFPSGMLRDTGATRVYELVLGEHVTRDRVVRTFDDADPALLGTVAEQEAHYREWLARIKT